MTPATVMSFIRQVLTFVGGYAVAKGWLDNATLSTIIGSVLTLVSLIWSWYTHTTVTVPPAVVATTAATPPQDKA